jgi:peptidoglycan/LPS O-acetylase OafA/YrhL
MVVFELINGARSTAKNAGVPTGTTEHYRPDIDGLRALAILPVMLFHAGFGVFSGGFVGVDVFFVISGYLITTIIARDQERGIFSILQFYERRVRRIVPALVLVVACCFIAAWLIMLPNQLAAFAKSVIYLVCFSSNFFFWHDQGYFEPTAQAIPLLHTWSIAVEEQFYAVFPIAMLLMRKIAATHLRLWFGLLAAGSLGLSIWSVTHHPGVAFYLAPSRAWELLLGSLLALGAIPKIEGKTLRNWLSLGGLGLIAFSALGYSNTTPFPGIAAIPPTVGTAILIQAGASGDSWIRRMLSTRPLVAVGLGSYSLYLWHWPLLVFAQISHPAALDVASKALLLLLAAVLATLTLIFVERPFRRKVVCKNRRHLIGTALASAAFVVSLSVLVIRSDGIIGRFDAETRRDILANVAAISNWSYPAECQANYRRKLGPNDSVVYCPVIGGGASSEILFWGDSEIEQLYPVVWEAVRDGSLLPHKVAFATSGGCPPILGLNRPQAGYNCDTFNKRVFERALQSDIDTIVMGGNIVLIADLDRAYKLALCRADDGCRPFIDQDDFLTYTSTHLRDQLRLMAAAGKRVIIFLPFPVYVPISPPDYLIRKMLSGEAPTFKMTRQEHAAFSHVIADLWEAQAAANSAKVIDPSEALCPSGECVYQRDHVSLYKDGFHLTADGARMLKPLLVRSLTQD